jgi:hypothetical protein
VEQNFWDLNDEVEATVWLDRLVTSIGVPTKHIGWDEYDASIELYEVPASWRPSDEQRRKLHGAGFAVIYVNHDDGWETHYHDEPEDNGWRVSYPHKRGTDEKQIWVEAWPKTWPQEWLDTGYVVVKSGT